MFQFSDFDAFMQHCEEQEFSQVRVFDERDERLIASYTGPKESQTPEKLREQLRAFAEKVRGCGSVNVHLKKFGQHNPDEANIRVAIPGPKAASSSTVLQGVGYTQEDLEKAVQRQLQERELKARVQELEQQAERSDGFGHKLAALCQMVLEPIIERRFGDLIPQPARVSQAGMNGTGKPLEELTEDERVKVADAFNRILKHLDVNTIIQIADKLDENPGKAQLIKAWL